MSSVIYPYNKHSDIPNKYARFVTFFSNELILFGNLGHHTVDGNSCVGIDQGRYYQLLAKTAQRAKNKTTILTHFCEIRGQNPRDEWITPKWLQIWMSKNISWVERVGRVDLALVWFGQLLNFIPLPLFQSYLVETFCSWVVHIILFDPCSIDLKINFIFTSLIL